jgi:hypothetical protein
MRNFLASILVLGLLSFPLRAQDSPRIEVFGGYQYLHTGTLHINGQDLPSSSEGFNGWNASITGNLNRYFGIQGDFSGTYDTSNGISTHVYTYTGGPVLSVEAGRIKPFVHALFGGIRNTGTASGVSISENGFTVMAGGGVDAKLNRAIAIRVIQADWVYYHFGSQTVEGVQIPSFGQSNNVRISTGIVFRF